MYIAIAGNIGSGKSILSELLSQRLGFTNVTLSEEDGENPYIDDFYDDMKRWSFQLQIYFLSVRWRNLQRIAEGGGSYIIDRTIYEDAEVFAKNLLKSRLLDGRDFDNYYQLYQRVTEKIKAPDLLIYLKASSKKLLENIKLRGRNYEKGIDKVYLRSLNERYEDWTFSYSSSPILVVDIDVDDIAVNTEAQERVIAKVLKLLKK